MEFFPDSDGLFKAYSIGIRLLDKVPICPDPLCKSILPCGYDEYQPGIMEREFPIRELWNFYYGRGKLYPSFSAFLMLPPMGAYNLSREYLKYLKISLKIERDDPGHIRINKVPLLRSKKFNINKAYEDVLC